MNEKKNVPIILRKIKVEYQGCFSNIVNVLNLILYELKTNVQTILREKIESHNCFRKCFKVNFRIICIKST